MHGELTLHIDALTRRVERLERVSHRWQIVASAAVAVLGVVLLLGTTNHHPVSGGQEIQARAFVLVDQQGKPLARLGLLPHGALGLGFYDRGKQSRILLSVEADGSSSVSLFGKDGKGGALLAVSGSGAASLRLIDVNWKSRVALATWPNGAPFLQLADRTGKDRILLGYNDLKVTATGDIVERSTPSLILFDHDETILWRAP
jgi:hypothetical protein